MLPGLPQGSLVMIENGLETIVHLGTGRAPA
jgi:probable phosphoglycerate mutase